MMTTSVLLLAAAVAAQNGNGGEASPNLDDAREADPLFRQAQASFGQRCIVIPHGCAVYQNGTACNAHAAAPDHCTWEAGGPSDDALFSLGGCINSTGGGGGDPDAGAGGGGDLDDDAIDDDIVDGMDGSEPQFESGCIGTAQSACTPPCYWGSDTPDGADGLEDGVDGESDGAGRSFCQDRTCQTINTSLICRVYPARPQSSESCVWDPAVDPPCREPNTDDLAEDDVNELEDDVTDGVGSGGGPNGQSDQHRERCEAHADQSGCTEDTECSWGAFDMGGHLDDEPPNNDGVPDGVDDGCQPRTPDDGGVDDFADDESYEEELEELAEDDPCTTPRADRSYLSCTRIAACDWCNATNCTTGQHGGSPAVDGAGEDIDGDADAVGGHSCQQKDCNAVTAVEVADALAECNALPQCRWYSDPAGDRCVSTVDYKPDNSPCFRIIDGDVCRAEQRYGGCHWVETGRHTTANGAPGICRGPCNARYAQQNSSMFPNGHNCGDGCFPELRAGDGNDGIDGFGDGADADDIAASDGAGGGGGGIFGDGADLMCVNVSTATCDTMPEDTCSSADATHCHWAWPEFDCPFSRCGRGSPCTPTSNCSVFGYESSQCCIEIQSYCGTTTDGNAFFGYGGGIDVGDGLDEACFSHAVAAELLARFQCELLTADPTDPPDPSLEDGDAAADGDWRSDSPCFNLEVFANQTLCTSLWPRCTWEAMVDAVDEPGGEAASGFCMEGGCGVMRTVSQCTGYPGNQCQWSNRSSECQPLEYDFDGDELPVVQGTPCYLLGDDRVECAAAGCIWWPGEGDDGVPADALDGDMAVAGSLCLSVDCNELPRGLCGNHGNATDDFCVWKTVGVGDPGDDDLPGFCFNTTADADAEVNELRDAFDPCLREDTEVECGANDATCNWYANDESIELFDADGGVDGNSGWCARRTCFDQSDASACRAFGMSACIWMPPDDAHGDEGICSQATCEALNNSVSCRLYIYDGASCVWDPTDPVPCTDADIDETAGGNGDAGDAEGEDERTGFESPDGIACFRASAMQSQAGCESEGCIWEAVADSDGICQENSCYIYGNQQACQSADGVNGLSCRWIQDEAPAEGEIVYVAGICQDRDDNGIVVQLNFDGSLRDCDHDDLVTFEACSARGYCHWVHGLLGARGCKPVDLQCDLAAPIACWEYASTESCDAAPGKCEWGRSETCIAKVPKVYPEPNAICSDDVTLLDRTVTGDLEAVTDVFQAATVGGRSTFAAGRYIEPGSRFLPDNLAGRPEFLQPCNSNIQPYCFSCGAVYSAGLGQTLPEGLDTEAAFYTILRELRQDCCVATAAPTTAAPTTSAPTTAAPATAAPSTVGSTTVAPTPTDPTAPPLRAPPTAPPPTAPPSTALPTAPPTRRPTRQPIARRTRNPAHAPPTTPPPTPRLTTQPPENEMPADQSSVADDSDGGGSTVTVLVVLCLLLLGGGGYVVYRQKFSYKAVINNGTYDNPSYDAYSNKLLD